MKKILIALTIPVAVVVAYIARGVNAGLWELSRWDKHVLSNMTALYFITLMTVAGLGGYIASKQKTRNRKIAVNAITLCLVLVLTQILGRFMPFIGYIGR